MAITVRIYNRLRSFQEDNRLDRLLAIAEDGVIDDQERPEFEDIISDLRQIIQSGLELDLTKELGYNSPKSARAWLATVGVEAVKVGRGIRYETDQVAKAIVNGRGMV